MGPGPDEGNGIKAFYTPNNKRICTETRASLLTRFPATKLSTVGNKKTDMFVMIMTGMYSSSFFLVSRSVLLNRFSILLFSGSDLFSPTFRRLVPQIVVFRNYTILIEIIKIGHNAIKKPRKRIFPRLSVLISIRNYSLSLLLVNTVTTTSAVRDISSIAIQMPRGMSSPVFAPFPGLPGAFGPVFLVHWATKV